MRNLLFLFLCFTLAGCGVVKFIRCGDGNKPIPEAEEEYDLEQKINEEEQT